MQGPPTKLDTIHNVRHGVHGEEYVGAMAFLSDLSLRLAPYSPYLICALYLQIVIFRNFIVIGLIERQSQQDVWVLFRVFFMYSCLKGVGTSRHSEKHPHITLRYT